MFNPLGAKCKLIMLVGQCLQPLYICQLDMMTICPLITQVLKPLESD